MRFDAQKAVDQFAAMVKNLEPAQRTAIEGPLDGLTKSLEVDLRRELPKALGDTCCVYSSPGEGGLVVLGLTAVVPIRNRDAVSVIQAKIPGQFPGQGFSGANSRRIGRSAKAQLHSFSLRAKGSFISPAWALAWPGAPRTAS